MNIMNTLLTVFKSLLLLIFLLLLSFFFLLSIMDAGFNTKTNVYEKLVGKWSTQRLLVWWILLSTRILDRDAAKSQQKVPAGNRLLSLPLRSAHNGSNRRY